jgi:putative endonuclease
MFHMKHIKDVTCENMDDKLEKDRLRKEVGRIGEDICAQYLESKGFAVVDRNYRKQWGEIDVIAKKEGKVHFVEVKSVSCESLPADVGDLGDKYRPEDNMHPWKLQRLSKAIQSYLLEKDIGEEGDWQFDVVTVYLDQKSKKAKVDYIEDVIL